MNATPQALALIKEFEGCCLKAYPDSVDVWTIGYGHIRGVKQGDSCTQEQADAWLSEDAQHAVDDVMRLVRVPITPGQFAALVSFTFNLGAANLARSTLLGYLNQGDSRAKDEFVKWAYAGGKIVPGLVRRRLAEAQAFCSAPEPE